MYQISLDNGVGAVQFMRAIASKYFNFRKTYGPYKQR